MRVTAYLFLISFIGICHSTDDHTSDSDVAIVMVPLFHPSYVRQHAHLGQELCTRGYHVTLIVNKMHRDIIPEHACKDRLSIFEYEYSRESGEIVGQQYERLFQDLFKFKDGIKDWNNLDTLMSAVHIIQHEFCGALLRNDELMRAIGDLKADLAVVDGGAFPPCQMLVAYNLSLPFVVTTSIATQYIVGQPWLPSVVPSVFSTYTDSMTFIERVQNMFVDLWLIYFYMHDDFLAEYAPDLSSYRALESRGSLHIHVRDHHLDYQVPNMPYVLPLPGVMPTHSVSSLPQDLNDFLADSPFVVVSFGSIANQLPKDIIQTFLDGFGNVPELKFVWYLQGRDLTIPSNVKAYAWLPQVDLLGHKNVKLFINHCGNSGQYEAATHGVPMLGFPLFTPEQDHNCKRVEFKGLGKTLHFQNTTKDELSETIRSIIHDEVTTKRVKKLSAILKSYKPPAMRAADAIEHVVKFGGEHLNGTIRITPWYKLYMIDLFLAAMALLMILIACCIFGIRMTFRFACSRQHPRLKTD